MPVIHLPQNKETAVSEEDFDYLNQWKWHFMKTGYAVRNVREGKASKGLYMHRVIMERVCEEPIPRGLYVDHIDGNGLNNQRNNLRLVTNGQNQMNSRVISTSLSSQFKGVCWDRKRGKWIAHIMINRKSRFIGRFQTEEQAALAYDAKAKELFGEFARPNFPDE